ncbi:MAG: recombinase family protein [Ruminococcaceae bacterium]|nr:recombinase family protein [Oscillospiraceae bacterium]
MKIAAAYIRVSTEDQIEYSPDSQLSAIQGYAKKNGYCLPSQYVFIDEGISGRTVGKREGFKNMIALAKSKPVPFNTILVWKYSRFARNREDSVVYKSMLRKQCGIDVVSISESTGDDKMSILFEAMIEAMDEYYSINLSEEVKRGMAEKAKRGGVLSIAPFGYKIENGEFVTVESEAEVIKNVFSSYLNGSGFLSLAKKLNALGVRTHKGNKIEKRTIEYWLNNPIYNGKTRWNPTGRTSRNYDSKDLIISEGSHKMIIDDSMWNAVQQKLKENKARYKKSMREPKKGMSHWLNGVLRCGKCGSTLVNCGGTYYCGNKAKALCLGNGGISTKVISKIIIDKLEEILDLDDVCLQFDTSDKPENKAYVSNNLRLLQVKIEEADKKLERIKEAYENGVDTIEEYKTNKDKICKEVNELKKLLSEEKKQNENENKMPDQSIAKVKGDIRKISDILRSDEVTNEEKNAVLKSIIKEIVKMGDDGRTFQIVFWNPKGN